ncbi:MAG TPA: hypothetical protein VGP63_11670 [Planctomycetaceae bacterium]|nr:hypothetical protein [Planctomycetaceae bacterium]
MGKLSASQWYAVGVVALFGVWVALRLSELLSAAAILLLSGVTLAICFVVALCRRTAAPIADEETDSSLQARARESASQILVGLLVGAIVTPVSLFLAIASTGGGHGDYRFFAIFYPMQMLLMRWQAERPVVGLGAILLLASLQFPTYGALIGAVKDWRLRALVVVLIGAIHSAAVYACIHPHWLSG